MLQKVRKGFTKAAYSAYRERAIGLGAMGFHSYLQRNSIPFESMYASSFNNRAFKHIKEQASEASEFLGELRGEAPDMAGSTAGILTFLLLLLTLLLQLYVVERLLQLSLQGLTYLRTRR